MSANYRDRLVAYFTLFGGIYFFLVFICPEELLQNIGVQQYHSQISIGFVAIGMGAFGLGLLNLFWIHGAKIAYLRKGWLNSLALISALVLMLTFSIMDWVEDAAVLRKVADLDMLSEFSKSIVTDAKENKKNVPPLAVRVKAFREALVSSLDKTDAEIKANQLGANGGDQILVDSALEDLRNGMNQARGQLSYFSDNSAFALETIEKLQPTLTQIFSSKRDIINLQAEQGFNKKMYKFLFEGLFTSLGTAMFSLLGVYIAAAAYRAFRIKSIESGLMMLAALIVMLGQIPFGSWIYEGFPEIRDWLLKIPSGGTTRGITIGAAIAGLVLAVRMWFSLESRSAAGDK